MGMEFQFRKMKTFWGMDRGDGCTTMGMYLMLLNCTLKMAKMVNFVLCIFYHNERSASCLEKGKKKDRQ